MKIDAGLLNKKIVIKKKSKVQDPETGFVSETEVEVRRCWASIKNTSGKEVFQSTRDFSETKTRFLVRWTRTPITKDMFIEFHNQTYEINYTNNYGENNEFSEIITTIRS